MRQRVFPQWHSDGSWEEGGDVVQQAEAELALAHEAVSEVRAQNTPKMNANAQALRETLKGKEDTIAELQEQLEAQAAKIETLEAVGEKFDEDDIFGSTFQPSPLKSGAFGSATPARMNMSQVSRCGAWRYGYCTASTQYKVYTGFANAF